MKCPKCINMVTKVIDSRITEKGYTIRRRRECEACDFRFTTYERIHRPELTVVKRNGQIIPFNKEEEANEKVFAKELAKIGDIYVNEAFSCSHRAHASVSEITKYIDSYAGKLLSEEVDMINLLVNIFISNFEIIL